MGSEAETLWGLNFLFAKVLIKYTHTDEDVQVRNLRISFCLSCLKFRE